ncbi:MAG: hypothetical protein QXD23_03695 [Candidatus Micrarchaeaceae archaeon]
MENLELKLNNKKENKLLKRHELNFTAYYKGETPNKDILKQEICKMENLNPSLTIIKKINQEYGVQECSIQVNSYSAAKEMAIFENSTKKEEQKTKEAKTEEKNPKA